MPDVAERLEKCFAQVFPSLPKSEIASATYQNVAGWDSIAQVTLLTLVGEEFNLDIDFEEFEGKASFASILETLNER